MRDDGRPVLGWIVTGLAALLVYLALVAPREAGQLTPLALLRIPVEGLLGAALLLVLPPRPRRVAAVAAGAGSVTYDMGAWRQDRQTQEWLRRSGYESPTTYVRMRIDLPPASRPAEQPPTPGVRVRRTDLAEDDLRAAHLVDSEAFVEHFGYVPVDLEHYRHRLTEHGPGFTQLWLAEVDGAVAGLLVGTKRFEQEHDAGYVDSLATLPSARGRGAGKALLRAYFAAEQAAGRSAVLLHVDVANVTGALAIYESVGMRPIETIDAWVKRVQLD